MICKHRGFIIVFCIGLIIMVCSICPLETDLVFKVIAISYLIGSACLFVRIFGIAPKCQLCIPIIEVGGQNPPWNLGPAFQGGQEKPRENWLKTKHLYIINHKALCDINFEYFAILELGSQTLSFYISNCLKPGFCAATSRRQIVPFAGMRGPSVLRI